MPRSAFPIAYASDVDVTVRFYERLGFVRHFEVPGYVGLRYEESQLAVVSVDWPRDRYGLQTGTAPKFEMFVYVDDADATVGDLRDAGVPVLHPPEDMPWGEHVGFVLDPDGNPVAIATAVPA